MSTIHLGRAFATGLFTVTLGLAVGWEWAIIPAALAYVGTLVERKK